MKIRTAVGAGLLMALRTLSVFAADPPAQSATDATKKGATLDPGASLERARELRALADKGDADAIFKFIMLLAAFGPGAYTPDTAHAAEWLELAGGLSPRGWLTKAAEAGSQDAIDTVCRLGEDPLAPARTREQGKARCQELRANFPAK